MEQNNDERMITKEEFDYRARAMLLGLYPYTLLYTGFPHQIPQFDEWTEAVAKQLISQELLSEEFANNWLRPQQKDAQIEINGHNGEL